MALASEATWDVLISYDYKTDKFTAQFHDATGHWLDGLVGSNTTRVGAVVQLTQAARRECLVREALTGQAQEG